MKLVRSSCSGTKKVKTCTFSPQVNIKNKREPIQTQEDVNAAHSEAKIQDLIEDLKNVIYTKVKAVATSESFGYDEAEVNDYFFVDVTPTEIGEDHHEAIRVEVRGEVSYEGLEDLMEALNPIIESYDSYAYFEPVEPGIIEAYVSVDQVDMSVYGGSEYADSSIEDSSDDSIMFEGNNYEYVTNNDGYWIYRAVIDGKGVWRAMKQGSDESQFSKLSFPISYEQARGFDAIEEPSSIARLRKDLGKMLLPNASTSVHSAQDLSMYSKQFHDAYTSAYIDFKENYPQVEVSEIYDDPSSDDNEICIQICDPSSGNCGKFYLNTEDGFVDSDYILRSFEETAEAIGLLKDNTVYSSVESSDYESDSGIFIEDIIDSLEDNGYDLSRIRSIRQGLLELFGYKGKDADIIIHDMVAGRFIDPNDWLDKDYTSGVYSATEDDEEDDEEELQDIIDELTADGFDVTDEADLLMGLGADLGMDHADARHYAKLILNHMDDSSVLGAEEDEDSLPMVDQEYDSAATSINSNKLPAIYKMVNFNEGDVVVDFGGGKFDNAVEYIRDKGATLCVYDPYNRSAEHNKEVLKILRENGGADAAVNSNVLNVIKEPEARKNVLENIARITKPGAPIYITVYEGKGNGQEGPTKSGYQLNRKTADYLEEIQEVFPDATRRGKLITAHNTGSVTSSTDDQSSSTILCSYDEFMTWYDNLSDEEQWKVDDIADTNGIPFYEEASDDELAWLHDVATIEIYASPVKSYTDVEEDISRYDKDIVSYRKIIYKSVEDSDDFLTDYTMYEVVTEDGSVEYECYFGDNDIYGPWNGEGLDFSSEDYDEAVEWYNSYSSDEIESSESIEANAFSSLEDQYLSPPEYDDSIEHEDSQELIEVELDQVITVDVDGDYEWDDDTYVWASPDGSNEEWRSEDGVYIDDKVGVVEHIDDLIIPNVPTRPGRYRVTGLAKLVYDVSGIQEYRTEYGPDDYDSDIDIDHAVVAFNFRRSEVENLKITPVRR